ncbi:class-II fumarase/aspartase family protein [Desulfovibrio litoralis]|uniref:Adenylosuccinate lyase n=1 Tax=Desulfovibrio litoralis DSM 11393 TaxID=1121455 RepID=A0A1M7SGR9_9BACT|nr:adenylosuccinate lyase family protein [Desulfovibrio litoralis]SHN57679.1 adenylosuccinate lyase [Desulfovibrio litoralis DSM 11393]
MSAHIMDSDFYQNSWSTEEMRTIFNAEARFERWLKIEAALAKAQAKLGIIPEQSAKAISEAADISKIDLEALAAELNQTGHTLVPLIRAMQKNCADQHGEYIHYGVATQDIEDTGLILEMREAYKIIFSECLKMEKLLAVLVKKYRDTVMMGRTHNQHALPTTLGLKLAGVMAEMRRNIERMKEARKRMFVCMCFGGVGTQAGLGEKATEVAKEFAKELGLAVPVTSWTNSRDIIAEYQALLAFICGTISRMGNELYQLSRTEILELHEPLGDNYIGSSTMPHKRNAEVSEFVVALCRIVINNAQLGFQGMMSEHERDARSWRLDWHGIPESSMLTAKALGAINSLLDGLQVYEDNIKANLNILGGQVFAEAVLLKAGAKIGKQTAHKAAMEAAAVSREKGISYKEAVLSSPVLGPCFTPKELDELCDYKKYIGTAGHQVDEVLALSLKLGKTDNEALS